MTAYHIPNHVHFAVEADAAVFLDLRSDQYSMMLGAKARAFSALLTRTSESIDRVITLDSGASAGNQAINRLVVTELLQNRLLMNDRGQATVPQPAHISLPEQRLLPIAAGRAPIIAARDFRRFLAAAAVAQWRLAYRSIENTVCCLQRRGLDGRSRHTLDLDEARTFVSIFNRLRPLWIKSRMCLFDSLALLEFLANYNCYPNWIFAVQMEPWAAHCWVQHDTTSFNQDVDEARTYLPLMIV